MELRQTVQELQQRCAVLERPPPCHKPSGSSFRPCCLLLVLPGPCTPHCMHAARMCIANSWLTGVACINIILQSCSVTSTAWPGGEEPPSSHLLPCCPIANMHVCLSLQSCRLTATCCCSLLWPPPAHTQLSVCNRCHRQPCCSSNQWPAATCSTIWGGTKLHTYNTWPSAAEPQQCMHTCPTSFYIK